MSNITIPNQLAEKKPLDFQPLHFKQQNLLLSPSVGNRLTLTSTSNTFQNNSGNNILKPSNNSNQGSKIKFINSNANNSNL